MLGMWQEVEMLMKWNGMEWNEWNGMEWNGMKWNARSVMNKNKCIVKDVNSIFYYIENLLSLLYNARFVLLHYKN